MSSHLPILRRGPAVPAASTSHGRLALPHARAVRRDEPGERRRSSGATCCGRPRSARTLADISGRASWSTMSKARRRAFPERHPADRSGEPHAQTPQDYVEQVSATTGMPWANVRRNMAKVHGVLSRVDEVLQRTHTRPRPVGARRGVGAARRPHAQFLPAHRRARHRAAQQLAGRALAVGAGHRC